jgi:hypothetical protein
MTKTLFGTPVSCEGHLARGNARLERRQRTAAGTLCSERKVAGHWFNSMMCLEIIEHKLPNRPVIQILTAAWLLVAGDERM